MRIEAFISNTFSFVFLSVLPLLGGRHSINCDGWIKILSPDIASEKISQMNYTRRSVIKKEGKEEYLSLFKRNNLLVICMSDTTNLTTSIFQVSNRSEYPTIELIDKNHISK